MQHEESSQPTASCTEGSVNHANGFDAARGMFATRYGRFSVNHATVQRTWSLGESRSQTNKIIYAPMHLSSQQSTQNCTGESHVTDCSSLSIHKTDSCRGTFRGKMVSSLPKVRSLLRYSPQASQVSRGGSLFLSRISRRMLSLRSVAAIDQTHLRKANSNERTYLFSPFDRTT